MQVSETFLKRLSQEYRINFEPVSFLGSLSQSKEHIVVNAG